jgi:hypothetical protein
MNKEQLGVASGGFISILSFIVYFFLIPMQVRLRPAAEIGPEFFPKLAVLIIGITSLTYAVTQAYNLRANKESIKEKYVFDIKNYINHIVFILAGIVFLLIVRYLGFAISAMILTMFLLFLFGSKGIIKNILIAVIYSVTVYYLFSTIVRVRFPVGIFGI